MGRDLGAQFRGPEGLADVVVGAQAVGGHGILLGHARGQEDDGPVEVRADLPHELEAVEPRHHDVAEHEIEAREVHPRDRRRVCCPDDLMAIAAEDARDRVEDRPFIIYCQYPRHVRPPETPVALYLRRAQRSRAPRAAEGASAASHAR